MYIYMLIHISVSLFVIIARQFVMTVDESSLEPGAHYAEVSLNTLSLFYIHWSLFPSSLSPPLSL